MTVVISDASPVNYLVLIGCIDLLRELYGRVVIPAEVFSELTAKNTPPSVSAWVRSHPDWLEVRPFQQFFRLHQLENSGLDAGELAALQLALMEEVVLLLIDDAAGRAAALKLNVATAGTLGILVAGSRSGLIDLKVELSKLQATNFRVSQSLIYKLKPPEAF